MIKNLPFIIYGIFVISWKRKTKDTNKNAKQLTTLNSILVIFQLE